MVIKERDLRRLIKKIIAESFNPQYSDSDYVPIIGELPNNDKVSQIQKEINKLSPIEVGEFDLKVFYNESSNTLSVKDPRFKYSNRHIKIPYDENVDLETQLVSLQELAFDKIYSNDWHVD